ncbi:MAG: hypothetical protein ACK4F0_06040 [Candidatus Ratteibacteria bacterium]
MKKEINYFDVIEETIELLKEGKALVCSIDKNNKPNIMAIGWGCLGIVWGKTRLFYFYKAFKIHF